MVFTFSIQYSGTIAARAESEHGFYHFISHGKLADAHTCFDTGYAALNPSYSAAGY
jgi:hypothetical protein